MNKIQLPSRESCLILSPLTPSPPVCLICQDLSLYPYTCSICKSIFCQLCILKWKQTSPHCPNRCSSPWVLSPHSSSTSTYFLQCPYSPSCPSTPILSSSFQHHLFTCPSAPKPTKTVYHLKTYYLCQNQHRLQWNCDRFNGQYLSKCYQCEEMAYCRSQCKICQRIYCVKCRLPELQKKYCPGREHMYLRKNPHPGFRCAKCGLSAEVLGVKCWDDMSCDFGLCEICYDELPEDEERSKNERQKQKEEEEEKWRKVNWFNQLRKYDILESSSQ